LDVVVRLSIRKGMMYKVLEQPVVGSKGILDRRSVAKTESIRRVASSKTAKSVSWYDMTLMDEESRLSDQSAAEVAGGFFSSVDRPFSNGGQLTCREDASPDANLMKTVLVLLGYLIPQHKIL
jgi:hypothetical protein